MEQKIKEKEQEGKRCLSSCNNNKKKGLKGLFCLILNSSDVINVTHWNNKKPWRKQMQKCSKTGAITQSRFRSFECGGQSWGPSPTLQPSSTERCAGAAASPLLTGGDWTDWLKRPALSWDALRDPAELVGERRMMAKLSSLMESTSDPMQDTLTALSSSFSDRLLHPQCVKERYHRSFYTAVILNTSFTTTVKEKKHKISSFFPFFSYTNMFLIILIWIQIRFFDSFWALSSNECIHCIVSLSYHKCYLEDLIHPQSHGTNDR